MRISDWSSDVCSSDLLYQQLIRLIGEDMAGRFDGKVALVTAAVDGIGAATAQAFGENGARVILADINADRGIRVNCIAPGVTPLRAHNLPIDGGCTADRKSTRLNSSH